MTESDKKYNGNITRIENSKRFGFIETKNDNSYFFFIDRKEQTQMKRQGLIDKRHTFCSGDEVEFQLRPSQRELGKYEAYNLKFIKNERRQKLIEESY